MSEQKSFYVEGMTCANCVGHVTEELTALDGVTDISIDLVPSGKSPVTLTSESALSEDAISAAVDEAGYTVAF